MTSSVHARAPPRLAALIHDIAGFPYRHISATVGSIATKFGTLTQFAPLDHSVSKIGPMCIF